MIKIERRERIGLVRNTKDVSVIRNKINFKLGLNAWIFKNRGSNNIKNFALIINFSPKLSGQGFIANLPLIINWVITTLLLYHKYTVVVNN